MSWHFFPARRDQVEQGVTQRDQFKNDDIELSETLLREAIQNSLDAALFGSGEAVRVRISLADASTGLDAGYLSDLLAGQKLHAGASGLEVEGVDWSKPQAIVIEDFGTSGLTGSVNDDDDGRFYTFWRRHGISNKTGKALGRWGLGKLVYSYSSSLGVFFGLTRREGENQALLMGQTVLNFHKLDGTKYPPHSFWSDLDNENNHETRIQVPIKDSVVADEFSRQFSLVRKNEPGLSVVVPFPTEAVDEAAMVKDCILNYFYPILTDQLMVTIGEHDLNAGSLRQLARDFLSVEFADLEKLFDFIDASRDARKHNILRLNQSWMDDGKLDEDDFDPQVLEAAKEAYAEGKLIALELPVEVKKKGGDILTSHFHLFLRHDETLAEGRDLYVRSGLVLKDEAKFSGRSALGLLVADDDPIAEFLAYAENAAHTKWIGNAEKLRPNYVNPRKLVAAVQKSLVNLYDMLAGTVEEDRPDALIDFFSIPKPDKPAGNPKSGETTPPPPEPPPPSNPRPWMVRQTKAGFGLRPSSTAKQAEYPVTVRILAAYETQRGDPFTKHNALDFDLSKNDPVLLSVSHETVAVDWRRFGEIQLTISGPEFIVTLDGFDPNRDVKYRVEAV